MEETKGKGRRGTQKAKRKASQEERNQVRYQLNYICHSKDIFYLPSCNI
jgi:hypothetical protein